MMETKGAKVPLCVAVIIVKSLEHTTMRRMIAVRDLPILATLLVVIMPTHHVSSPSPTMEWSTTAVSGRMHTISITSPGALQRWMLEDATFQASGATVGRGARLRRTWMWRL